MSDKRRSLSTESRAILVKWSESEAGSRERFARVAPLRQASGEVTGSVYPGTGRSGQAPMAADRAGGRGLTREPSRGPGASDLPRRSAKGRNANPSNANGVQSSSPGLRHPALPRGACAIRRPLTPTGLQVFRSSSGARTRLGFGTSRGVWPGGTAPSLWNRPVPGGDGSQRPPRSTSATRPK